MHLSHFFNGYKKLNHELNVVLLSLPLSPSKVALRNRLLKLQNCPAYVIQRMEEAIETAGHPSVIVLNPTTEVNLATPLDKLQALLLRKQLKYDVVEISSYLEE